MKNFTSQFRANIDNLSERDKRVLLIAVPIVLILLCYLLIYKPISEYHSAAIQNMEAASDDYYWLRAQSPPAKSSYCGRPSSKAGDKSYFEQQAKRNGMLIAIAVSGAQTTITITSAKGAAVLRYINNLTCNGYKVDSVNVTRAGELGGKVLGSLVVNKVAVSN
jgi:type II secretory pathway component PulM